MSDTQRNFLIIIAVAVAAMFLSQVAAGLAITSMLISLLFLVLITVFLWQLFQRNRTTIASMRPVHRVVLLGSAVGIYILLLGQSFLAISPYGFFAGLAICILGLYWSWTNRWAR